MLLTGRVRERGAQLAITNLRLVWICHRNSRINLSIGYSAVQAINIKTANSRLRGNTQALHRSGTVALPDVNALAAVPPRVPVVLFILFHQLCFR